FWFRQNWRGFNQAELIAKTISRGLKLKLTDKLGRIKSGQPQSRLPRSQRLTNVSGVFCVKPGRLPKAILLVDDVWTTGATMTEAMTVFKQAGVKAIWGLSLAR
ncbi:MAG: hypothetical protein U1C50_00855, partial [Patescibacteria group bacterium]|nr:hypothetical protein [Patescibacteria group bacterium]